MFKKNKYSKWYFNIIESARKLPTSDYSELHHIIPRSMGGDNSKDNLVRLSARQHFICHLLLTKMSDNKKLAFALTRMLGGSKRYKPRSSKIYELCKKLAGGAMSGKNNPMFGNTNPKTKEHAKNISDGLRQSRVLKESRASEEYRLKISDAQSVPIQIVSCNTGKVLFTFKNARIAAERLGCTRANLTNAIRDNRQIGKRMKTVGEKCMVRWCPQGTISDELNDN
jgi:hypothetical protein